ncbi:MAG: acyltransferase [Bacteroidota bacterium]
MNAYLSRKLRVISFILIVMVVFLHAHNISGKGDLLNYYVQNFISTGITKISVALFFVISGYLFFFNIKEGNLQAFLTKIKSRSRTVLLPYLLWSLWGILLFFLLQSLPFSKSFFNSDLLAEKSSLELLHIFFIKPLPYQLWFLRHLFVFALLSPLIYFLTKSPIAGLVSFALALGLTLYTLFGLQFSILKIAAIVLALLSVLFYVPKTSYPQLGILALVLILLLKIVEIPENDFIHNRSIAYFCLGCYLGIHQQKWVKYNFSQFGMVATALWIALVAWRIMGDSQDLINDKLWRNFIQHFEYFVGIFALWSLYDFFQKGKENTQKALPTFLAFAFFLYVSHEPILTIIKKLGLKALGKGSLNQLLLYFAAPLITIGICIVVGILLKKITPKIYSVLTGGR